MAVNCGNSIEFGEGAPIAGYRGSSWGERVFCSKCGSTLVWQTQDRSHQVASMQAFDDPSQFQFTGQIFVDYKPDNYTFANETRMMTEAEVFAKFAPSPDDAHD